jgi:hypothetical protein
VAFASVAADELAQQLYFDPGDVRVILATYTDEPITPAVAKEFSGDVRMILDGYGSGPCQLWDRVSSSRWCCRSHAVAAAGCGRRAKSTQTGWSSFIRIWLGYASTAVGSGRPATCCVPPMSFTSDCSRVDLPAAGLQRMVEPSASES